MYVERVVKCILQHILVFFWAIAKDVSAFDAGLIDNVRNPNI